VEIVDRRVTVAQREIQSVEVSCFVHATEDEVKVKNSISAFLGIEEEPTEEILEGHFGNRIIHARWHLTGEVAWNAFRRVVERLGKDGRAEVLRDLAAHTDEHGALYLRINKQSLIRGTTILASSDPVRVRVKPRGFMMKGSPEQFYGRLLESITG
jgi:RNA binding exosome subunit